METMCRTRAVFTFQEHDSPAYEVECLLPYNCRSNLAVMEEAIIVQLFHTRPHSCCLAVLHMEAIRHCLQISGVETLDQACDRPTWVISKEDLHQWFDVPEDRHRQPARQWELTGIGSDEQLRLRNIVQGVRPRRRATKITLPVVTHPWQTGSGLPWNVKVDLENHELQCLTDISGWEVCKRNARVLITTPDGCTVGLDSAQYGMLIDKYVQMHGDNAPVDIFMQAIVQSCNAQRMADCAHHVPWSRHFLACLQIHTNTTLLIGARAVTWNPYFSTIHAMEDPEIILGAVKEWTDEAALLLLDSFAPRQRPTILDRAQQHKKNVWILRYENTNKQSLDDLRSLRQHQAHLIKLIPRQNQVVHATDCWSEARWDGHESVCATQLWLIENENKEINYSKIRPLDLHHKIGDWNQRRYDFHLHKALPSSLLHLYRQNQQDALRYGWDGIVAASDGGADLEKERAGAGYIATREDNIILDFSAAVGGPAVPLRAEAAGLLHLVVSVREREGTETNLLIFIDCLVLLTILCKWGSADFWPGPLEVVHFDIIRPLVEELRKWTGQITLKKIKSHAGCYHNEMADERASAGLYNGDNIINEAPRKYGSIWIRVSDQVRNIIHEERIPAQLPRNSAPNKQILKQIVRINIWRASKERNTIFVRELLMRSESATIARTMKRCNDSVHRYWMQMMNGTYPTETYLHRIGKSVSRKCKHCNTGKDETFGHFACACPTFREARTAAHNQVRKDLAKDLRTLLSDDWTLYEEKKMQDIGLQMQSISTSLLTREAGHTSDAQQGTASLGRWQPDIVAISWSAKKIGILDVRRTNDSFRKQLDAAAEEKRLKYNPLVHALKHYSDQNWDVAILPWVVGIRGLIDKSALFQVLDFLQIPKCTWNTVVETTALSSVQAFTIIHRARWSRMNQNRIYDTNDPNRQLQEINVDSRTGMQIRVGNYQSTRQRWLRMTKAEGRKGAAATTGKHKRRDKK